MNRRLKWIVTSLGLTIFVIALTLFRLRRRAEGPFDASTVAVPSQQAPRARAPDLSKEPRAWIFGRVTDPGKAPIAQATVCATFGSTQFSK
jgi:hypothetical protein